MRLQLGTDDREAPESAVDELLVQVVVVVQDITENSGEQHQEREQGKEAVVRDERCLAPGLVVAELLQDRERKSEHPVSLLELVHPAHDHLHAARSDAARRHQPWRRGPVPADESAEVLERSRHLTIGPRLSMPRRSKGQSPPDSVGLRVGLGRLRLPLPLDVAEVPRIARATIQVTTKTPTMTNPARLMLKSCMKFQKPPVRFDSWTTRPRISMVPMNKRDEDREPGDGEVVIDLADRFGEGPVVGEVHETAVDGVKEAHPGRKEDRERENGVEGKASDRGRSGQHQERHLGGGVEPQAEEHPNRVHLPGCVDPLGIPAEEPVHQTAGIELALELGIVVATLAHLPADLEDREQDDKVQERRSGRGTSPTPRSRRCSVQWCNPELSFFTAPSSARSPKFKSTARTNTMVEWPSEKKIADAERPLPVLDQLASGVVDGGDVVGIEGVPHAEGVSQDTGTESEELGLVDVEMAPERKDQHGPTEHVEADDGRRHPPHLGPFPRGEALADPGDTTQQVNHDVVPSVVIPIQPSRHPKANANALQQGAPSMGS